MDPELFRADLEAKPATLRALAEVLADGRTWADAASVGLSPASHIVLLGMGSSHYATVVAAARLRAAGIDAVAEIA
jgi:fructoselysine-6-P-deglycase FrlB-like protein